MKFFFKENWFKVGILFCVLIIAISVSYFFTSTPGLYINDDAENPNIQNEQQVTITSQIESRFARQRGQTPK